MICAASATTGSMHQPVPMRACGNFGLTSAPRLPQAVEMKPGSMSDSLNIIPAVGAGLDGSCGRHRIAVRRTAVPFLRRNHRYTGGCQR